MEVILVSLFFAIQFYLTIFGGFMWPFSSHRLFSQLPGLTKSIVQVKLIDCHGQEQFVHPGRVLPLEYARCSGLLRQVASSKETYDHLHRFMLGRLRRKPWFVFDEMLPMVRGEFVDLVVEEHEVTWPQDSSREVIVLNRRVLRNSSSPKVERKPQNISHVCLYFTIMIWLVTIFSSSSSSPYLRDGDEDEEMTFSHPHGRITLIRRTLALIGIVLVNLGPHEFYTSTPYLFTSRVMPWLDERQFGILTRLLTLAGIASLLNSRGMFLFAPLFTTYQYYTTCFSTTYWLTNTHLSLFSLLITLEEWIDPNIILRFMVRYIGCMYFQAGLSKLLLGGPQWFLTGRRIWTETLLLGTPLGKYLISLEMGPSLFAVMGWMTFIFELILAPCLIMNLGSRWVAIVALLFHAGTFSIMGISFFFVWFLFPGLFFYDLFEQR